MAEGIFALASLFGADTVSNGDGRARIRTWSINSMANSRSEAGVALSIREKLILAGLFLSKYDNAGLKMLGFNSFAEAFNAIGYALGSKPASLKNYRDEFDPLFPNSRVGWHKRKVRDYCLSVYERYGGLDASSFAFLIRSFFQTGGAEPNGLSDDIHSGDDSSFAQRLVTGLAAEKYFEAIYEKLPEYRGMQMKNTTSVGCGYDFRLWEESREQNFLAVEVKGLRDRGGSISITPKEYEAAGSLGDRFSLFVVRNFREVPYHDIFPDPLSSGLRFKRVERILVQVSWSTNV